MGFLGLRVLMILDLNFYCGGFLFLGSFLLSVLIEWVLLFTLSPSFVMRVIEQFSMNTQT